MYNQSMGRKSERAARRAEILRAFAKVLADHGYAGATITAIAAEAGLSPGLLHHHFRDKAEMLETLLSALIGKFSARLSLARKTASGIDAYIDAALKLDQASDLVSARCWVGIFSEALRSPELFKKVRHLLGEEVGRVKEISGGALGEGGKLGGAGLYPGLARLRSLRATKGLRLCRAFGQAAGRRPGHA